MIYDPLTPEEKISLTLILDNPLFQRAYAMAINSMQPDPVTIINLLPHQTAAKAAQLSGAKEFNAALRELTQAPVSHSLPQPAEEWVSEVEEDLT